MSEDIQCFKKPWGGWLSFNSSKFYIAFYWVIFISSCSLVLDNFSFSVDKRCAKRTWEKKELQVETDDTVTSQIISVTNDDVTLRWVIYLYLVREGNATRVFRTPKKHVFYFQQKNIYIKEEENQILPWCRVAKRFLPQTNNSHCTDWLLFFFQMVGWCCWMFESWCR